MKKSLKTEITINASAEKVWNALMDHESYGSWNPFIKSISGSTSKGETLRVTIHPEDKKPMTFAPEVLAHKENREFRWKGKLFVKGLFDGEHYFQLEEIDTNHTRFVHGENFTGVMAGVLLGMISESTHKGFIAMNQALKHKVESAN